MSEIVDGAVFEVTYPFVWEEASRADATGCGISETFMSWRPGTITRYLPPDNADCVCAATGHMLLTIVSVHKPGKFPTRVFFTRRWRDPDGKEFGKGRLHIKSVESFKRRVAGYWHEYEVIGKVAAAELTAERGDYT